MSFGKDGGFIDGIDLDMDGYDDMTGAWIGEGSEPSGDGDAGAPAANTDIPGCMDPTADNFIMSATYDDGSCAYGGGEPCQSLYNIALTYKVPADIDFLCATTESGQSEYDAYMIDFILVWDYSDTGPEGIPDIMFSLLDDGQLEQGLSTDSGSDYHILDRRSIKTDFDSFTQDGDTGEYELTFYPSFEGINECTQKAVFYAFTYLDLDKLEGVTDNKMILNYLSEVIIDNQAVVNTGTVFMNQDNGLPLTEAFDLDGIVS
tara:strand:- start:9290 stop:10072 length:783 start_codon:yes stop_codon:yes gene_type:complete